MNTHTAGSATSNRTIAELFTAQVQAAQKLKLSSAKERLARLASIYNYLQTPSGKQGAIEALQKDFQKPTTEIILSELGVITQHYKFIRANLRKWMAVHRVPTPLPLLGTQSYQVCEPKGVALVISPWNYPLNLTIIPLMYAMAAGNAVVVKPSEYSAHTSAFIGQMIARLFPAEEVAVCQGDVEVASALLQLPFNHIHFTGNPTVGKIVMQAAAKHLASVTLELGGKSPAVIDESADIALVALKTAWAKSLNAGQTCIAPDYLIIHESKLQAFIEAYKKVIKQMFQPGGEAVEKSDSLARIISHRHHTRLVNCLEDALSKGAKLEMGGEYNEDTRFFAPTLLSQVNPGMQLMQEEIFGPILPVITYSTTDDILQIVARQPKPLTFYIHSQRQSFIDTLLKNTSSGGAVINDYLLGFANPNLPFGGVNNSGIGKSLGFQGFKEFSNEKSVIHRRFGDFRMFFPPYNDTKSKAIDWLLKNL